LKIRTVEPSMVLKNHLLLFSLDNSMNLLSTIPEAGK
jgi:hypothetical protein